MKRDPVPGAPGLSEQSQAGGDLSDLWTALPRAGAYSDQNPAVVILFHALARHRNAVNMVRPTCAL
jgi:hypothetical protein